MSREEFLRRFHDARPGVTSQALARSGSYEQLAARVLAAKPARVLDVACGDGYLASLIPGAIGIDISRAEADVASVRGVPVVRGRAQQLPFADASFDAVACHLAFMLFDDIEAVVSELARVLRPGGQFHAMLGGGPAADADDAFACFASLIPRGGVALGDRRAKSEAGWRALFGAWRGQIAFDRIPIDLSGSFDDVWRFLGSSYQLEHPEDIRAQLRAQFPHDPVPCTAVMFYARVTR